MKHFFQKCFIFKIFDRFRTFDTLCIADMNTTCNVTFIKLTHSMQHNWIKHKQTFSAFLILICCFIRRFVTQADSIKTVVTI